MSVETDLAYAAGVFDGEGSVIWLLRRNETQRHKGYVQRYLCISNTEAEVLLFFRDLFGGNVREAKKKQFAKFGPSHFFRIGIWEIFGLNSVEVAKKLVPYSIIKRRQLELYIESEEICNFRKGGKKGNQGNCRKMDADELECRRWYEEQISLLKIPDFQGVS